MTVSVVGAFLQFDSQVFRNFRRCPAWCPVLSSPPSVRIERGFPLPDSANALRRRSFFEPGFPRPGFANPHRHLWSFSASYCSHDRLAGHIVAEPPPCAPAGPAANARRRKSGICLRRSDHDVIYHLLRCPANFATAQRTMPGNLLSSPLPWRTTRSVIGRERGQSYPPLKE